MTATSRAGTPGTTGTSGDPTQLSEPATPTANPTLSRTRPGRTTSRPRRSRTTPTGFELKFLYLSDDPLSVAAKDQLVKGLEEGGFTATAIASTKGTIRDARSDPDSSINVRSSGWCSDWPSGSSWFPAQWHGSLVGDEGMPNLSMFKEPEADARQRQILSLPPAESAAAWGEFYKWMQETFYPAVVTGYLGIAMIRGSQVGGMHNDSVRGMPTFQTMYLTAEQ